MSEIISTLSKMWLKVISLESSLFPELKASLGVFSSKKEKLIKILDFVEIEKNITVISINDPLEGRANCQSIYRKKNMRANSLDPYAYLCDAHNQLPTYEVEWKRS
ncbi:hypothetical protein [Sulfurimonas sp.]|jgi:hypothetical protein|uniref:hypothetical protein n=1 Tax=Sulfurimonas sp. TaxID=2022749 RepID=UPI0025CCA989|nr:hypothetical protein [Sulfurimonas sp.]MBT5934944.1 hypothetical protein [Sulfurimonas sp.]